MKLVVLLSVIHDTEDVMKRDWRDADLEKLDIRYARRVPDLFDEAAAEYALRVRDALMRQGLPVSLTALLRGSAPESLARNLYAVGFDRLIVLDGRDEPCRDPERIAALAADWIRADGGCDCVFLGQMDSVCCEMSVPGRLAGKLGLPCIGFVADLDWQGDGFRVKRRAADGWLSAETEARGVYGFYNAAHAYLRMATLREKLKVSGRTPETAPTPAPAPTGQELLSLRYGMRERHCRFLEETEPEKAAAAVLRWMRGEESAHA